MPPVTSLNLINPEAGIAAPDAVGAEDIEAHTPKKYPDTAP